MDGKPLGLTDAQAAVWNNAKENRKRRLQGAPQTGPRLRQTSFFNLPAPPVGVAWDIQWRWNKSRLLTRIQDRYPDDIQQEVMDELDAFGRGEPVAASQESSFSFNKFYEVGTGSPRQAEEGHPRQGIPNRVRQVARSH